MKVWLIRFFLGLAGILLQQGLLRLSEVRTKTNRKEQDIFDEIVCVAQGYVKSLMDKDMASEVKKAAVFASTQEELKVLGIDVATGMINLAIEIAYNALEAAAPKKPQP